MAWPEQQDLASFKAAAGLEETTLYERVFLVCRDLLPVQNERIAVERLRTILEATFELVARDGFEGMTLRALAARAGMSLGGIYAYIKSKEDLAALIQTYVWREGSRVLTELVDPSLPPRQRLEQLVRAHIYVSTILQPWFYFGYMEAKTLPDKLRRMAIEGDVGTETIFREAIEAAAPSSLPRTLPSALLASHVKAMVQTWYVKASKFRRQKVSAEAYAASVIAVVDAVLSPRLETA